MLSRWPHLGYYEHVASLHEAELAVGRAAGLHDVFGSYGPCKTDQFTQVALEFAYLALHLFDAAGNSTQFVRDLSARLRESHSSLRPLRFELDTYSYGLQRGFEVVPADLLGLGQYDFLMRKGPLEIAVECKHVTADAGMVIERRQALELFDRIIAFSQRRGISLDDAKVLVTVPDRLDKLDLIANSVCEVLSGSVHCTREMPAAKVEFQPIGLDQSHALLEAQDQSANLEMQHGLANKALGLDRTNHLYVRSRGGSVTVLALSSSAETNQAKTIFKRLIEDAKRQLPDDMPGAIMVELQELLPEDADFFSRRENNDLLVGKVHELFRRRPWVHGISFVAGSRRPPTAGAPPRSGERPTLVFVNPWHPQAGDTEIRSLYGL